MKLVWHELKVKLIKKEKESAREGEKKATFLKLKCDSSRAGLFSTAHV